MDITLQSKKNIKLLINQFSSVGTIAISITFIILLGFLFFTPQILLPSTTQTVFQVETGLLSDHATPQSECGEISSESIKRMTLVAQPVVWEVAPGQSFSTWSFNGTIPEPTIC